MHVMSCLRQLGPVDGPAHTTRHGRTLGALRQHRESLRLAGTVLDGDFDSA